MNRRSFLHFGIGAVSSSAVLGPFAILRGNGQSAFAHELSQPMPVRGLVPVVGDGKWVWTEPPKDQTGYLQPRQFDVNIGIQLQGKGTATQLKGTTAVPVELPGQKIDDARIETQGCAATIRKLAPEAGQLMIAAPGVVKGQTIGAVARFRLTLYKDYRAFAKDKFPAVQEYPTSLKRLYMYDTPGIQTRHKSVRQLAREVGGQFDHPWDKAEAYYKWVWENIKPRVQYYTSVIIALRDRIGDCEERAAVFVALCRASGIPARLVWIPNHNWAEFYLNDDQGKGHWIPSHTSAYSWFGWTGAHEMILQKGDSIQVPEKRKPLRLLADWMQWQGARPEIRYLAEIQPVAEESKTDAGPGARRKDKKGEWVALGKHAKEKYVRQ